MPVLHLQWLIAERNQTKQAWYRCIELLEQATTWVRHGVRVMDQRYLISLMNRPRTPSQPMCRGVSPG